jgi:hypothetical protein
MSEQPKFCELTPAGRCLAWLADAPMFIDGEQVTALYNAVAKPEYESGTLKISLKKLSSGKIEGEGSVEAELGVASWLKRRGFSPSLTQK